MQIVSRYGPLRYVTETFGTRLPSTYILRELTTLLIMDKRSGLRRGFVRYSSIPMDMLVDRRSQYMEEQSVKDIGRSSSARRSKASSHYLLIASSTPMSAFCLSHLTHHFSLSPNIA